MFPPFPTKKIKKSDHTVIINRGGYGAFILHNLFAKKEVQSSKADRSGKEITCNG
jgi:hypothetical protein